MEIVRIIAFSSIFAGGDGKAYLFNNMFPSAGGSEPN